jgi:uncharacterized protein YecT (DUF1311 family)
MRHPVSFMPTACLLMASCLARAEDPSSGNCGDLPTGSEQKQCAEIQYRKTADELKEVFGRVLERASKADIRNPPSTNEKSWTVAVTESQQAWETYRDAECRGIVGRGDGSGRLVWVLGCLTEKAKARTKELNVPYDQR